jgi:hypothetical protein
MDLLVSLLSTLNSLSPLAVIALLALVLYYQAKNGSKSETNFDILTSNHLHELPVILETLQRMENAQSAAFATIIAKLNGGHK